MPPIRYTRKEVSRHTSKNDLWLIYGNKIFDISHFVEDHPGGADIILEYAGKDVTGVFHQIHVHSEYAKLLLDDYQIGQLDEAEVEQVNNSLEDDELVVIDNVLPDQQDNDPVKRRGVKEEGLSQRMRDLRDDKFLNLAEPLMPQVFQNNWSKAYYLEQVHIPRYTTQSPRFFPSNYLEIFTKNTWYGVLLFWIPIVVGCCWFAGRELGSAWTSQLFMNGVILWTLYEYFFHRFVFHMTASLPDHPKAFTLHFLMHGVHHFLPMDRYRLVMPPLLLITLSIPIITLLRLFLSPASTAALLAGSYTGYLVYDMMHYYFHHGKIIGGYLQRMKTYHMDHHYVDPNLGFGVSNLTWDAAFDTLLPLQPKLE